MVKIIIIIAGAISGFLYWKFVGCASGSCAITSNKYTSTLYGAVFGLLIAQSGIVSGFNLQNGSTKVTSLSQEQFSAKLNEKNVVLLDMRTPQEVSEGYIPGAINIDYYNDDFGKQLDSLYKSKTYLIYCRSGSRSAKAGEEMIRRGIKKVYHLDVGMQGWKGVVKK